MRQRLIAVVMTWVLVLGSSVLWAADATGPNARAEAMTNELLAMLKNEAEAIKADDVLYQRMDAILSPYVDFPYATLSAVGKGTFTKKATSEQRKRLVSAFKRMLIRSYSSIMRDYAGSEVEILPLRPSPFPKKAQVRARLLPPAGGVVEVKLDMLDRKGWSIYDIEVEGIQLISGQRAQFSEIIKKDGIDGLIQKLETLNVSS